MPEVPTPWIGLAALAAMVVLPLLPTWFFDRPRRIKPWPREHVCAKCDGAWTDEHTCFLPAHPMEPSLYWDLHRPPTPSAPKRNW